MSTESDIHAVVTRWRRNVKGKFRGIASFEERAEMRFNAIKDRIYRKTVRVDQWQIRQARHRGWNDYEFLDKDWRPFRVGDVWGGDDTSAFFRQSIVVPDDFDGEKIGLHIFVGGDSLLKVNGRPFHGMDIFRSEVILSRKARAGERYDLEIESYMNFNASSPKENDLLASDLVVIDDEMRSAYWDLWCAAKALAIADIDLKLRSFVEFNLWEAMKLVPLQEPDREVFKRCVLAASDRVRRSIYATDRLKGDGRMDLVGHSHLDVVFLWPYREFVRKIGRTHATMLRLMEEYPEFRFCQSQAKIYADMKTFYPSIFEEVKARVAEGRWETVGALWVEPDCNLISGESMVRQILHGQRFFRENFGKPCRVFWHPDIFGAAASLPQVLVRSGIPYFVTSKLVPWNDTNPWTLNTFWWEGLDGSRVLSVVPPGHFMGTVDPDVLDRQWRNFADKATVGETLHVYGWGNGGGGVDPEMIESGRRYQDFPGLVPMRFSGVEEACDRIAARAGSASLPALRDEIYLEAHRGTYTHKGRLKKLNRRAEWLYREAEMLASLAWACGAEYPEADLDAGWKALLTAQFHDSLPGTHIPVVYAEIQRDYEGLFAIGERVRDRALDALIGGRRPRRADSLLLFNSHGFACGGVTALDHSLVGDRGIADANGIRLPQQEACTLDGRHVRLIVAPAVPAVASARLRLLDPAPCPDGVVAVQATDRSLENEHLRAQFNETGELVSLFDKDHGREVLVRGQRGNVFQMFEDTPGKYDAWDIVETYQDHPIDLGRNASLAVDERGPVRSSLRLERPIGASKLTQRISLEADGRRLQFETRIDWVERQRLLKVAFTVEVNASYATYDIPFGNMARPTHRNTSYDRARFEVPAHQWMDLSQADYGVSLLNDGKYGCDGFGKTLRLTLLKGSVHPDPNADKETHTFTYALYPHAGDWRQGETMLRAMALNHPLFARPCPASPARLPQNESLLHCTAPNLTIEAVKRSEDGSDLMVRMVERWNALARAELFSRIPVSRAWTCDLMENVETELETINGAVRFQARPYEIVTLRLRLADGGAAPERARGAGGPCRRKRANPT